MTARAGLGAQLHAAVAASFAAQADEHGRELHARAVEMRSRDPMVTFLLDTFDKAVRKYGARAVAAQAAGDRGAALESATACEAAARNGALIRAAVAGDWGAQAQAAE